MPAWIINLLVTLAIKLGLPWVIKKLPWIPAEVINIIEELLGDLKSPEKSNSASKKVAIRKVKAYCANCNRA